MKKVVVVVLMAALMASCQGKKSEAPGEAASGARPFKYGFISWGTADEHGRTLNAACRWAVEAAGGEFIEDGSAVSAETTIAAAENLIQAGCNMIAFCTYAGEASVPQISRICQQNQVYWTMWDTTIADQSVQALIDQDPYFVGTTNEDQVKAGYETMKYMIEKGAKNVLIMKYGVNIPTCDNRVAGAEKAVKEFGINIAYEVVVGIGSDWKKSAQDALVAYPQIDSAFMAGAGQQSPGVAAAFQEAGKKTYYLGAFDYHDGMGDMLEKGELNIINGGHMVTGTFSALMAINSYFGTPLSKEKYQVNIPYLVLTSKDDFDAYIKYASQGAAYSPDEMRQFIGVYNPQLNLQTFQAMVDKWSVADIKARKEG